MSLKKHKKSLKKIAEADPDFAEFLKNEDGNMLLSDESDSDDSSLEEEESLSSSSEDEGPKKLEVASDLEDEDESNNEMETGEQDDVEAPQTQKPKKKKKLVAVTLKMVKDWVKKLQSNSVEALTDIVGAFRAAINFNSGEETRPSKFEVKGGIVYNAVVGACMVEIVPMLLRHLALPVSKDPNKPVLPSSSQNWKSLRNIVKIYLTDMIQLMSKSATLEILEPVLKHGHQLIIFYACFPKLPKPLLKKLIELWSTSEDTVRVLALRCLVRLVPFLPDKRIEFTLNQMYLACVKNCKFTSTTTLPQINYMKNSLVEMFCIRPDIGYRCAFIYIQQMAKHLHNALRLQKKEKTQQINNWQFCHSLSIWSQFLCHGNDNDFIRSLIHPLTEIILGTIRLNSSILYLPMRFFCVRCLIQLSDKTRTYIPIMPIITEPLELPSLQKQSKQSAMKSCTFAALLKMTKAQIHEKAFLDAVVDQIFELMLHYGSIYSHSIGFPELVLSATVQMKKFLKSSRVINYTKKVKQILEKFDQSSSFIKQKRTAAAIDIRDSQAVTNWEKKIKDEETPLSKFYSSWFKVHHRKLEMEASGKDKIKDDVPVFKRSTSPKRATVEERQEFSAIFESDGENEEDDNARFELKADRPKKRKAESSEKPAKKPKRTDDDDDMSDFDEDELAILAQSPKDGSEEEEESEKEEDEEGDSGDERPDVVEDFVLSDNED